MAVYFPRGQQSFATIQNKFLQDLVGAAANDVSGMAFVTNQELTLAERATLTAAGSASIELYHLERITTLLDSPPLASVRKQFLSIDYEPSGSGENFEQFKAEVLGAQKRLESVQTGGDSFCYFMLYHFDLQNSVAQNFVVIRRGEFPLYDVRIRIRDMDAGKDIVETPWGEMNAPADYRLLKWKLPSTVYYRAFFHARNGSWHQDLILRKSETAQCWLAATRVLDRRGKEVVFEHADNGFATEFGEPVWRA
jgi:hypothetical protein